jgi:hypothetical protein
MATRLQVEEFVAAVEQIKELVLSDERGVRRIAVDDQTVKLMHILEDLKERTRSMEHALELGGVPESDAEIVPSEGETTTDSGFVVEHPEPETVVEVVEVKPVSGKKKK